MEVSTVADGLKFIGMGLCALGFLGAAIGVGNIFSALLQGIARNPSAKSQLMVPAFIGAAFAELMGLLAFVVVFIIKG
ncbi:MAG: ATP synthase subunit C family protein [Pseudomonadota bacterium]